MSLPKTFPMRVADGKTIDVPSVGFGTWMPDDKQKAQDSIVTALHSGYRHLDNAWSYSVTHELGAAVRESGIPRDQIFVTSKAWLHFLAPENVELALDKVLEANGLQYIDLFLAHYTIVFKPQSREALEKAVPNAYDQAAMGVIVDDRGIPVPDWAHTPKHVATANGHEGSFVPTWLAMQDLVRKGKCRAIGLSNFGIRDIEELIPYSGTIPISCDQIEAHPWLPQNDLIAFQREHHILTTVYGPFGGAGFLGKRLIDDPVVLDCAERCGLDVGRMLQSWAVQRGTVPLGKSKTSERIRSNLEVRRLDDETMEALDGMEVPDGKGMLYDIGPFFGFKFFVDR